MIHLILSPLVDTKEHELSKFSTLLGQNIKEIKELLNGEYENWILNQDKDIKKIINQKNLGEHF